MNVMRIHFAPLMLPASTRSLGILANAVQASKEMDFIAMVMMYFINMHTAVGLSVPVNFTLCKYVIQTKWRLIKYYKSELKGLTFRGSKVNRGFAMKLLKPFGK